MDENSGLLDAGGADMKLKSPPTSALCRGAIPEAVVAPQSAVVTGASSGIGHATVTVLQRAGFAVVGVDVAQTSAADVHIVGDVAIRSTWDEVLTRSHDTLGDTPLLLVANAGVVIKGSALSLSDAAWEETVSINLHGTVQAIRALLPGMVEAQFGAIVTVASVDGLLAEQDVAAYCATKGAVVQLTRSVALDFAGDNVRANCVCPGVTDTPFFRRSLETSTDPIRRQQDRARRNPIGRILRAEEVAEPILFLLSDQSSGMTGSVVVVDGGLTACFEFN
jgi:NAD(P)-dependent dehydrogenase (short-subunit alcohol dehydrogenase family)